ncbi:MAG: ABC transporter ATP-binding protein [Desulfobacterales bacterium]
MNRIVIDRLRKDFFTLRRGRIRALEDIDLTVAPGSFFVLLGPSGCGKSTLLNIIAGIEKPTAGEIRIGDRQVVSVPDNLFLPPRRRDVAMVFQSYALYPHMTVYGNIAFPLKIAGTDTESTRKRVRKVAAALEIEELLDARPGELSGGQRQRVALGRAIVRKPKVLLLDEPLSNLDALLRTSMRAELKQIQRRLGVTTVYVTHDQMEAMTLGDRIAVLKDGAIQQSGSPDDIYHRPANRFVAGFIGTPPMNLLDGVLLKEARKPLAISGVGDVTRVELGVRPEHLSIISSTQGVWRARLELATSLGSESVYYLNLDGRQILVRGDGSEQFEEMGEVGIDVDADRLHVFDKKDGRRIR